VSAVARRVAFFAIRTGPIVTMLNTSWIGGVHNALVRAVAVRIGSRQRTA
jgi:hypothetical protein